MRNCLFVRLRNRFSLHLFAEEVKFYEQGPLSCAFDLTPKPDKLVYCCFASHSILRPFPPPISRNILVILKYSFQKYILLNRSDEYLMNYIRIKLDSPNVHLKGLSTLRCQKGFQKKSLPSEIFKKIQR